MPALVVGTAIAFALVVRVAPPLILYEKVYGAVPLAPVKLIEGEAVF